jgi:hypothetical protein
MLKLASVILWPSFLVAIVADGAFFSLFDPHDLASGAGYAEMTPLGAYSVGFFLIWLFCALASWLTWYLASLPGTSRLSASS